VTNLRRATPDDAPALAAIHVDSWREAYRGLVPDSFLESLDRERRAARLRDFLDTTGHETYVVEVDGHIVGHLTVGPCRDEDLDDRTIGEIWGIYLAPTHWRRGIGTEVTRRAEEILSERALRQIVLWVFAGNRRGRSFYETLGYAADGAAKVIDVGAPLSAVRYRKMLASPPHRRSSYVSPSPPATPLP
jgi:RimJ/RimL family protein N-acetyltransferase